MCNFKGSWGAHKERIIAFTQMPNILNMNWFDGMSLGDLCYLIGLKVIPNRPITCEHQSQADFSRRLLVQGEDSQCCSLFT
jgi:hypothetical protein